jgi:hypothetical protein
MSVKLTFLLCDASAKAEVVKTFRDWMPDLDFLLKFDETELIDEIHHPRHVRYTAYTVPDGKVLVHVVNNFELHGGLARRLRDKGLTCEAVKVSFK